MTHAQTHTLDLWMGVFKWNHCLILSLLILLTWGDVINGFAECIAMYILDIFHVQFGISNEKPFILTSKQQLIKWSEIKTTRLCKTNKCDRILYGIKNIQMKKKRLNWMCIFWMSNFFESSHEKKLPPKNCHRQISYGENVLYTFSAKKKKQFLAGWISHKDFCS